MNQAKTIGILLEALALPFLVIVAILFNMEEKNLGEITILLIIGIILFFSGFMLSHIPKEDKKEGNGHE